MKKDRPEGPGPRRLLSVEDVAQVLGVRAEAVRIFAREGRLEAFKVGRRLRFRSASVDDFLETCRLRVPKPSETFARWRRGRRATAGKEAR